MPLTYRLAADRLREGDTILVVGCGGTGGFVAEGLCRMLAGARFDLVLVDHDRVEQRNLHRQNFYSEDLDKFKPQALAERLARKFGRPAGYSVNPFQLIESRPGLVIGRGQWPRQACPGSKGDFLKDLVDRCRQWGLLGTGARRQVR